MNFKLLTMCAVLLSSCAPEQEAKKSAEPASTAMAGSASSSEVQTIERICQLVLDSDVLAPYYHVDTHPERKPLYVAERGLVRSGLRLTKFGLPVSFAAPEALASMKTAFIDFKQLEIKGDQATVEVVYPVEGISCTMTLARRGSEWIVLEKTLKEH